MKIVLGILSCLDGYMHVALEDTEEIVNGRVTNRYGDSFLRGNNSECRRSMCETMLMRVCYAVLYITKAA